ncbi:MAG: DNA internalization-related competence protein ComEC/Rec2 [Bacilli bacterium]|nr:DNA internalization-related competence protein ComEC/Rec2 [Bacilli bacterium]
MQRLRIILQSKYLYIILLLCSFCYVFITTCLIKYKSNYIDETLFNGIVENYKIDGNKISITFNDKEKLIGNYYVKTEEEKNYYINKLKFGSSVKVIGSLSDPYNNTIPNTFNYKKYLYNKRIYKIIKIESIKIDNSNINLLNNIKNTLVNNISKKSNYEYIKAFIIGDRSSIDINDYDDFKKLGITHLFAISGMHIALFSTIIFLILTKLKRNINITIIISLLLLFFYGLICNFPASIRRAYILYLLLSINKIFNLNIKTIYLLFLTITINIFIDPFIIYDIGFLYSITTTMGLIISSKYINGNYVTKLFKVSLLAYLFSLPLTINNNYIINLLTPINNIIIVPLVSIIIYPLSLLSFIIPIFNPILDFFINILLFINNILLKINIINIVIPKLSIFMIFIYYIILLFTIFINKKFIAFIILLFIIAKQIPYFNDTNNVYFFDVSQGDSSIIISPHKKDIIMIDTGGKVSFEKEEWKKTNTNYKLSNNIITFLRSLGIYQINKLVLTHGDYDHMGEAINLVENFKVEKVIFNCGPYNDLEKELIKVLDKKKIKHYSCIKELNIDKNKLYFLQTKEYDNENDNSNVIYTELNGYKFMFMGDASIITEKEIMNKYNLSDIDVLKVGHHGSKTSSSKEFIDEIEPKYSVISVGKNNRYGHPNKEVLGNLDNSKIYRTDQDGSVMFKIKNNKLRIETCSP